ncbi:Ubiquitin--protein ligase [Bertholletia excelsa]
MSTRGLRQQPPLRGYVRNSKKRKMVLEVDLNIAHCENMDQEGTSAHGNSQNMQPAQQGGSMQPAPIDVEAFDDDVVISSPQAFAEAKNNSRRNRGSTIVVDVDSEERISSPASSSRTKRRRVASNQTIMNNDLCIILGGSNNFLRQNAQCVDPQTAPPPPPPPKELVFSCPICMGPLVDETSTKCGHIFCKKCLKAAIAAQGKCPTCRRKVTIKDTIRIYLPTKTSN